MMQTDVLIVGAGPAGLATALGLAQAGVDFMIVDRLGQAQNTSRAAVIHAATLEALGRLGVADDLIKQGIKAPDFRVRNKDHIILEAAFSVVPGPFPFALMIPQDETEAILLNHLERGGHQVLRPAHVTRVEQASGGVRTIIEEPSTSKERVIGSRFVIGADGENSFIRSAAGIAYPGGTYGSFLLADVHMDWPFPQREVGLFFAAGGTLVVAPMSKSRFRVVAQRDAAPAQPTVADVQSVIDERGPSQNVRVREVIWGSRFKVHHKLAERFAEGPFLLVGDAAHVHSPAGGQGMNLGIRDAEALARALAGYLSSPGEQLAEYSRTRRTAAQQVLERTDRLTKLATLRAPALRWGRDVLLASAGQLPPIRRRIAAMLAGYA